MVGGLIGQCTWSTQVKGCGSDAAVVSTEDSFEHADTVGGLIGQWENSADSSSITDCWFGGSVSCENIYSAVGGILGANFDENQPGVDIQNCLVATREIRCAEPGNITWIGAVVNGQVTNCISDYRSCSCFSFFFVRFSRGGDSSVSTYSLMIPSASS